MSVLRRSLLVMLLVGIAGCHQGSSGAAGLQKAGPSVAAFAEAAGALQNLGHAVASTAANAVPTTYEDRLTTLGNAAQAVLGQAEPEGTAGVGAIREELAPKVSDAVRHIVTGTGGQVVGTDTLMSSPPDPVTFRVNVSYAPTTKDGSSKEGKAQAKERLKAGLQREVEHLLYVALLADPGSRGRLAPHRSPSDLPAVLPDVQLSVRTTQEWRDDLFDPDGRLVVPSPLDAREWISFTAWAEFVNPDLGTLVASLAKAAFS